MKKVFILIFAFAMHDAVYADTCADGYTWNTTTLQCEITCSAGYYIATAGGTCVPFPGGDVYYMDVAQTVAYGETSESFRKKCYVSTNNKYKKR